MFNLLFNAFGAQEKKFFANYFANALKIVFCKK